jgi:TonB-linked SusC/RagA family outer membrane protein
MKKTVYLLLVVLLFNVTSVNAQQAKIISGRVISKLDGTGLPGVNIMLKGSSTGVITLSKGEFELQVSESQVTLIVSFIGFKSQEILVEAPKENMVVSLEEDEYALEGVTVLSTGFQQLPAERATGSFAGLDQELVDRRVSANIVDRLEDVTPGLIFNRDQSRLAPGESISIRGTATLLSSREPLIVVDNLAYDGPLSSINPNDVASITVLKDAAAASIWGARAGNGVIVITTKKGKYNEPLRVNLTANVTAFQEVDTFYDPKMKISNLVDKQIELYEAGYYIGQLSSRRNPLVAPVAESLYAFKNGLISDQELASQLDAYRNSDIRQDLQEFVNRRAMNQQYAVSLHGGGQRNNYVVSLGWDKNLSSRAANDNSRLTLSTQQNWKLAKEKLQVGVGIYWVQAKSNNGLPDVSNFFPYDRLADGQGNHLSVSKGYSSRFKESVSGLGLLNWDYVPLDEIGLGSSGTKSNDIRMNANLGYQILPGLSASLNYQYWKNSRRTEELAPIEAYTTRDLINNYTEIGQDGLMTYHVPMGGVLDQGFSDSYSHNLRGQLTYEKQWKAGHQLNLFGGFEVKSQKGDSYRTGSYGYDDVTGTSQPVDYLTRRVQQASGYSRNIPFGEDFTGTINRFVSAFGNLGYTYQNRYLVNASVRKDASNLFGVNTNQKAVPLWSAGLGWILSEEEFLKNSSLEFLKLRASYGFNGNTNSNATALTTAYYYGAGTNTLAMLPSLRITSPPNPHLRWERIKIVNLGLDYELVSGRLSGSLEYYTKQGLDLLGARPLFPSSGLLEATLNYASTKTNGWDIVLNSKNLTGDFSWETSVFYSNVNEKVTAFDREPTASQLLKNSPSLPTPYEGNPLFGIYSYPFAGLDPDTGDPLGFVDGEPSADYGQIINQTTPESLIFHGSGRPTNFGAVRNTFSYKGWNLSVNISYRMGYYIRRGGVSYNNLNFGELVHANYEKRWRNPGDEQFTDVPSPNLKIELDNIL